MKFLRSDSTSGAVALPAVALALVAGVGPAPLTAATWAAQTTEREGEAQAGKIRFEIPSQSLATALDAFSAVSGVHVLYDSDLARGRRSAAVAGVLTPTAALKALLAGAGMLAHYTNESDTAVVLFPAHRGDPGLPSLAGPVVRLDTLHVAPELGDSDDRLGYRRYAGVVRADVQNALERKARTLSGRYTIGIRLWISPTGAILHSEVFRSTGDGIRDAAVGSVLQQLVISKPPPTRMPQPVSVVIVAHHWQDS
jgi:hypothetical protein